MSVSIADVTNGVVTNEEWGGTGVFDKLVAAFNDNIEIQFNKGRIKGTDYANVYLGGMQAILAQSIQFAIQEQDLNDRLLTSEKQREKLEEEIDLLQTQDSEAILNGANDRLLKTSQTSLVTKQGVTEDKKALLVERQTKGFDDDAKQKLLKQALDSWSVAYSVAKDANSIPDSIKVDSIDSIMKSAMSGLTVNITTNPLGLS